MTANVWPEGRLRDLGQVLLDAAFAYWDEYQKVIGYGTAVTWLQGSDGSFVLFTRGEYSRDIIAMVEEFGNVREHYPHSTKPTEYDPIDREAVRVAAHPIADRSHEIEIADGMDADPVRAERKAVGPAWSPTHGEMVWWYSGKAEGMGRYDHQTLTKHNVQHSRNGWILADRVEPMQLEPKEETR